MNKEINSKKTNKTKREKVSTLDKAKYILGRFLFCIGIPFFAKDRHGSKLIKDGTDYFAYCFCLHIIYILLLFSYMYIVGVFLYSSFPNIADTLGILFLKFLYALYLTTGFIIPSVLTIRAIIKFIIKG